MKIVLATWLYDQTLGRTMTKRRGNVRLLSYFFLREQGITDKQLEKYIRTGRLKTGKNADK